MKRLLKEKLMCMIGKGENIVFVHYFFDHPKHNPWECTEEDLVLYEASENAKDEEKTKALVKSFGGKICQSIILPVPRKQYIQFMAEIEVESQRAEQLSKIDACRR